jgi:ubiquinone biosynthesis protein UbiJ
MVLETPFAGALNHLLATQSWARERLAPFAGESLELRAPPLPTLRFRVCEDRTLEPAPQGAETASLVLTLRPEAPAAALLGEEHLLRAVDISGNARLASEIMFLSRHLRWDAEEDLSRWVGDIAAHRIAGAARDFAAWQRDAARRIGESLVEYAVEERPLLVPRIELERLAAAQAGLRDALDRLERRIQGLEAGGGR